MPNINPGILEGVRRTGLRIRDLAVDGGLPGAPLGLRVRGATKSGPPATGSWRAGDLVTDRRGIVWMCVTAGTPGWWVQAYGPALYPTGDQSGALDVAMINAAFAALPARGGTVQLGVGDFYTSAPIVVPAGCRLAGSFSDVNDIAVYGTTINTVHSSWAQGSAPFAAGVILNTDGQFDTCNINCHFANSNGMDGVTSNGNNLLIRDLNFYNGPNNGVNARGNTWRGERVMVTQAVTSGFTAPASDSDWIDCNASASQAHGWVISNAINSRFVGCRAEFNSTDGYHITGDGTATGGMSMIGCCTDRNNNHGLYFNSTGNWPLLISGMMWRRDGANGTGNALNVPGSCTSPLIIDGFSIFPGFEDNGSGTQGPVTGVSIGSTPTYVSATNGLIHAVTTAVSGSFTNSRAIATRTGSWNSPSAITMASDSA